MSEASQHSDEQSSHAHDPEQSRRHRGAILAFAADLSIVGVFVAIGRRNHHEGGSLGGYAESVAPFALALCTMWVIGRLWRDPRSLRSGILVWVGTIGLGMVLRRFVFDDGTATAFIIVATIFVGTLTNGWRTYARFRASS